jgi:hypothetical protein
MRAISFLVLPLRVIPQSPHSMQQLLLDPLPDRGCLKELLEIGSSL